MKCGAELVRSIPLSDSVPPDGRSEEQSGSRDTFSSRPQPAYTAQAPQSQPAKRTPMAPWVIVLIGCGALVVIGSFAAIIAAVAVPTLIPTRNEALQSFAQGMLSIVRNAEAAYYAKEGEYGDLVELVKGGYLDSSFDGNNIADFDGRKGLNIAFSVAADRKSFTCIIDVPKVGKLHLDQTGEITGP
jgi:type II secretory pathway pseudopilin PulG